MLRTRSLAALGGLVVLASTLSVAPATTLAGFDASNVCSTASALPLNTWAHTTITYSGDIEWWKFTVPSAGHVLITLGGLPANYRLDLYGSCATPIAHSDRSGVQYEELYPNLAAGTYRLEVTGDAGAFSSSVDYGLRVRTLSESVQILSSSGWEEFPDEPRIVGEVLNNTSVAREDVAVKIRFYDVANNLLAKRTTYARRERFGPRQRSMFVWSYEVFSGYDHYTISMGAHAVASFPPLTGLSVVPASTTPDGFGGIDFAGTLHNSRSFHVGIPRVMITLYDKWGAVRNAEFNDTTPDPMLPHSDNAYLIHLNDRNTGNRTVFTAHGYQN